MTDVDEAPVIERRQAIDPQFVQFILPVHHQKTEVLLGKSHPPVVLGQAFAVRPERIDIALLPEIPEPGLSRGRRGGIKTCELAGISDPRDVVAQLARHGRVRRARRLVVE